MTDEAKLKPCPFCQSDNLGIVFKRNNLGVDWHWVECLDCHAEGPKDLGESGAVEGWNIYEPATCTWTRGEYEDTVWATSCSQLFILDDGTPADNDMKFCAYCGKPLVEAQPEPGEDVEL
jgi:hypothetical protein